MIARSSLAALLFAAACSPGGPTEVRSALERDTAPVVSSGDLGALIAGNNAFAADLYGGVAGNAGNLVISPYSISSALAMTYAGAATTSATQIATALHYTLPAAQLHAAFDQLDLELTGYASAPVASGTRPFELHVASSLWGQHGMAFQARFLDTLATDYDAGVYVTDFASSPESSRKEINTWVADQTDQLIKDLIPEGDISIETRFVLTDAIYFNAGWLAPFDHNDTAPQTFHAVAGDVSASMMHQAGNYDVASGDRYQAVRIPYANAPTSMIAILPEAVAGDTVDPLTALEATLTGDQLASIVAGLAPLPVTLSLPKFQLGSELSLREQLQALGMVAPFDPATADFSGIDGALDLHITDVVHQGYVHVDEDGTIAAAATAVIGAGGSAPDPSQLTVTFDHPFLYLIQDDTTGQILFMGRVADPTVTPAS